MCGKKYCDVGYVKEDIVFIGCYLKIVVCKIKKWCKDVD